MLYRAMSADGPSVLWAPGEADIEAAWLTEFLAWQSRHRGPSFHGCDELWRWSVED